MFGDQVIKSFTKRLSQIPRDMYDIEHENMEIFAREIGNAQHFHMGSDKFVRLAEKTLRKSGGVAFMDDLAKYVKLPYETCWFDFIDNNMFSDELSPINNVHGGLFVGNVERPQDNALFDADVIFIAPCYYIPHTQFERHMYGGRENTLLSEWFISSSGYNIKIGKFFKYDEAKSIWYETLKGKNKGLTAEDPIIHKMAVEATKGNIIQVPLIAPKKDLSYEFSSTVGDHISKYSVSLVNAFLMILGCKNVVTETVFPTRKIKGKLRSDKKKFKYKVLKLQLPKSRKKYLNSNKTGRRVSLHLCDGHFKTYTEEAPLMGKHVGRFWWQPHMRGDGDVGTVFKDYHAEYETV